MYTTLFTGGGGREGVYTQQWYLYTEFEMVSVFVNISFMIVTNSYRVTGLKMKN